MLCLARSLGLFFLKMSLTVEDFQLLQAQINKLKEENYEVKEREQKLKKGIFHNFLSSCSVFILPMFLLYLFELYLSYFVLFYLMIDSLCIFRS